MTTKAGPSIEIEVPGRTSKSDRQSMYAAILLRRFTLSTITRAPFVRITVTVLGPDLTPAQVRQAFRALGSEIPAVLEIEPARLEWRYERKDARKHGAKVRIEARELVIISQEVSRA